MASQSKIEAPPIPSDPGTSLRSSMSLHSLEKFCERMGVGLRSGVDLLRLWEVEKKHGTTLNRQVADEVIEKIRGGNSLAQAMKGTGGYYPALLVQMVSAGEEGGRLERVLLHMASYYRDLRNAKNAFLRGIAFPLIQLGIALVVISGLIVITGIVSPPSSNPKDLQYDATGIGLSGIRGLIFFWMIILSFSGFLFTIAYGIKKDWFQIQRKLVPWAEKIPVLGTVVITLAMSRMSMTLSMLLNAGVEARRSLREAFRSTGNQYYIEGHAAADAVIAKGGSFAKALEKSKVIPNEFVTAVEMSELSGTETESLEKMAVEYNQRAQVAISQMAMTLSFLIWGLIAIFLIFMIIRMFMSYVDLLNNASKF